MDLKKTPLYASHLELKARMVPFAGFEMPLSYDALSGGTIKEHCTVREKVGIFDISHMGEFFVSGKESTRFLSTVCTKSFEQIPMGRAQYCLLLNENGMILDDVIVYRLKENDYWMVVNAANIDKDFRHLSEQAKSFEITLKDQSENTALIAIQGPEAASLLARLIPECVQLKYYFFKEINKNWVLARTGYTGEDGFEIFLPNKEAPSLWQNLLKFGALPIGLGARDTLRLEVGFPLYGHELSENLRPQETFASFAMDLSGGFIGASKAKEIPRYAPIGLLSTSPKPIRQGEIIVFKNHKVGFVTSGSTSPVLKKGMGLGLLEKEKTPESLENGTIFMLESGGKQREAVFSRPPFVETARTKKRSWDLKRV